MAEKTIHLIITRQDGPDATPYKEEFKIPYRPNMNVIGCLRQKSSSYCLGNELS